MSDQAENDLAEDLSDREFGRHGIGLSEYRYPTGWFIVAWADDIHVGEVKRVHYFGQELVVFRTESGAVHVLDAYCRHLGAHLGVGGKVKGECIVCPWHGWHWNGDGSNAAIPYSRIERHHKVRVPSWPTMEWCGMVLVWHDRHGRPPYWQPPSVPELDDADFYPLHPHGRMVNRVKVHPQMIVENAADPYHVELIHKNDRPARTTSFRVEGHHLHATVEICFGGGHDSTWLTPDGPVTADVVYDTYGMGLGFVRFPREVIETVQVTSHTPVDEEYTDYFHTQSSRRAPGETGDVPEGRAARFLELQRTVIKQDFFVWENMAYLTRPTLAPEEARDYAALRRWAHRFYPGPEPTDADFGYGKHWVEPRLHGHGRDDDD